MCTQFNLLVLNLNVADTSAAPCIML